MSINQALSAATAGVDATQQALSVIAGNVANANTAGYVDESVNQVAVANAGLAGTSVDVTGVNRNLNTLLQSQLWTETSGGSFADTTASLYQQLQGIYGTPGSVDLVRRRSTIISPAHCRRCRRVPARIPASPAW